MAAQAATKLGTLLVAGWLLWWAIPAHAGDTRNLTGLPAYPNLASAVMDNVYRTDTLGHWCMRFWASTSDSLPVVESWYRKNVLDLTEIDLSRDKVYSQYTGVVGVKLVIGLGIDYVVLYKTTAHAPTSIDLYRCSP